MTNLLSISTNKRNRLDELSVAHWNCFKLNKSKIEELRTFLNTQKPDIISLNELKLSEFECNYHLRFDNYQCTYKVRTNNADKGGGVAFLIKTDLIYTNIDLFDDLNPNPKPQTPNPIVTFSCN